MITYTNFNPDGMPLDENGKVIDVVEGRPRLFDGTKVIEFDNEEQKNNYISMLNISE